MSQAESNTRVGPSQAASGMPVFGAAAWLKVVPIAIFLVIIYWQPFQQMYGVWTRTDSYYTHGFLVAPISVFLLWRCRRSLLTAPVRPSLWGFAFLLAAVLMLVLGAFLGFAVFVQLSVLPMLVGLVLVLLGMHHLRIAWFPLVFLIFMIPIPPSITQSFVLDLKLLATRGAVGLARALTLPVIHEGSFVYFRNDQLLIGEVCGGLRSLIALLAVGALVAYYSKAKPWARVLTLAVSGPIAIASNVFRIFLLCVVGYFWGSDVAAGTFHDVSGVLIFVVAFVLFFLVEALLRRWAPAPPTTRTGG